MARLDPLLDLPRLRALAAVVETGSFEAAAAALRLTPSAVSQRVKALEQTTGAVLVRRGRPARATAVGEPLIRLARQVDALGADATAHLTGARPVVPLAVNSDSLATWVLAALTPVVGEVAVQLHREDQDRSVELLRDGTVMAAITAQAHPVQGCTVTRLGAMRYRAMCTAAFRDSWLPRADAAALAGAPVIVFDPDDDLQDAFLRTRGVHPAAPPRHLVPSSADLVAAVRAGWGWALVPDQQREPDDGLVPVDRGAAGPGAGRDVELFWQQWSLRTAGLDRVAAAVRAGALAALRRPPAQQPV